MFKAEDLKVYFRGKYVPFKEANISIANTGFLYGLAVFTGIRAYYNENHKKVYIFRADAHYRRMYHSSKLLRYKNFIENVSQEKFIEILSELFKQNNLKSDAYIRVTNFSDEIKITPRLDYEDSLAVYLYPLGDYVPVNGIKCKVSSWKRADDNVIPARAKINGLYVNSGFAKTEALLSGFDEAIFLDDRGHVVEGSAENIFVVIDDKLITPPVSENILEGITRDSIIQIAKDLGIEVFERSIDRTELYKADEVFLTGTGAKVCPVVEIDHYKVGTGEVGKLSQQIQKIYFDAVKGNIEKYKRWLIEI